MNPAGFPQGELFEHFVELVAVLEEGGDTEALFARHPRFEGELRSYAARWQCLDRLLSGLRAESPSLGALDSDAQDGHALETLARLTGARGFAARYELGDEIGRGGMGVVRRVRDRVLGRDLALKRLASDKQRSKSRLLRRFLEEAELVGRLEHPGIVPIHELGLDDEGRVYFTMPLVRGRTLGDVLQLAREGREGWTRTRVIEVLLKVCDAVAYAHSKGVVHRDLKPANVLIGHFGEVFVVDWGLARVLGSKEGRTTSGEPLDEPAVLTLVGEVIGTPAYMAPEQAEARRDAVDQRSDVYALGAILYELLTGARPYALPGKEPTSRETLEALRRGPPCEAERLARDAPAELASISRRAMARDPGKRYPMVEDFASDLRAYVEGRVVRAHEGGAWAESRKWVGRNRSLSLALLSVIVSLVVGLAVSLHQRQIALAEKANVFRLSAFQRLEDLQVKADQLWPVRSNDIPDYESWLRDAHALVQRLEPDPAVGDPGLCAQLETLRQNRTTWTEDDSWWASQLSKLVGALEAFADPESGLIRGVEPGRGWGVQRRLAFAGTIVDRSLTSSDASRRWSEAIASIADAAATPQYGGLVIAPQVGLLPIGRDPDSGLWEFVHLMSGAPPDRDESGRLVLNERMGVVLVLIPGGTFFMGSQPSDPRGHNYDPLASPEEEPVREVSVPPFFLSKFEMTQGQWLGFVGSNPSQFGPRTPGSREEPRAPDLLHPVERVSWTNCEEVLERMGLALPTEAQWERAARAGTQTRWWAGNDVKDLQGAANLADAYAKSHRFGVFTSWERDMDDGASIHAPVGAYRQNAFGLCDVIGNLMEWCQDGWSDQGSDPDAGSETHSVNGTESRLIRGGSFVDAAVSARSSSRDKRPPEFQSYDLGVRPAKALSP